MAKASPTPEQPRLNPSATDYDAGNSYFFARAAQLAYERDAAKVRDTIGPWGFSNCELFESGETQGFVAASAEDIVVSFRGTEGKIEDWLTDAKIRKTAGPFGEVHRGFEAALELAWSKVDGLIQGFMGGGRGVWFTGHSLGAALATLAVARMLKGGKPVRALYTIGSPRVGDSDFEKRFDQGFKNDTFRCVNNNDIVTRVPTRLTMGYRHIGRSVYISEDGTVDLDPGRWTQFLDRLRGRIDDFLELGTDGLKDHSADLYVKSLGDAWASGTTR